MSEDIRAELDTLRDEVRALARQVGMAAGGAASAQGGGGATGSPAGQRKFPREALWRATAHLAERADKLGASGLATYAGCYTGSDGREYRWKQEKMAEELLGQDTAMVARVLAALGHRQRLALLKEILERPAPAAALIERLGLTSTGQAYHHLNTLQAAGLIRQGERGQFEFVGHVASAFLTLLAGVWDLLSSEHGAGAWEGGDVAEPPARAQENAMA
ncbi:MAG TPA: winged helix-turn-helix domain-containing protein [Thermomicrobiales bacterium]|nr:winged helix-turn-helix domain-containing protein [Thermomicrobiales bacterium]